jgi:hypothetical protein
MRPVRYGAIADLVYSQPGFQRVGVGRNDAFAFFVSSADVRSIRGDAGTGVSLFRYRIVRRHFPDQSSFIIGTSAGFGRPGAVIAIAGESTEFFGVAKNLAASVIGLNVYCPSRNCDGCDENQPVQGFFGLCVHIVR